MGSVKMSNYYSVSYLGGVAAGGSNQYCSFSYGDCATGIGMFSTYGYDDAIEYSLPLSSTLSVSLKHVEPSDDTNVTGLGSGAAAYTNSARHNTLSVTYKAGALVATAGYRNYDRANEATGNSNYRHRASASYDLGVAQIGAGYEQTTTTYGATTTDSLVSLVLPVAKSPLTLSAQFGNRTKAGNASSSSDTTYSGTIYNAVYTLSKRTYLLGTYATNQAAGTSNPTMFLTTLNHSF
jgi:predicted porin